MIWWALAFFVAIIVDTVIRWFIWAKTYAEYTKYMMNALRIETEKIQKEMLGRWGEVIEVSTKRFGIAGEFIRNDTNVTKNYKYVGQELHLATGIIMNKQCISSEEIVDNIATLKQANPTMDFKGTARDILTKHFVEILIQGINKLTMYDDKGLFDNVESGDSVALSLLGSNLLGVGYVVKPEQS